MEVPLRRTHPWPLALVLAAGGACSFPDVTFATDDGGLPEAAMEDAPPAVGTDAEGADASADGAPSDAQAKWDGVGPPNDGGSDGSDVGDAADAGPCDQDRDGFLAKNPTCGGDDCDDNDPHRNPGVKSYVDTVTTDGDWNCDGTVEKESRPNVECSPLACLFVAGMTTDPGCGQTGTFITCAYQASCAIASSTQKKQGCR
jgi:hypothetical protein